MASSSSFVRRIVVGGLLGAAALVCACGARGPLDIIVVEQGPLDASVEAAPVEASVDARDAADAPPDVLDAAAEAAMGFDGGPLVNCGICLAQTCGTQLLTCVTSPMCTTALQCVAMTCLAGGGFDPTCLLGCTNNDPTTQGQLGGLVSCVFSNCSTCLGALGGLGGLGGGGGGGG